jgi:hypothetical protein
MFVVYPVGPRLPHGVTLDVAETLGEQTHSESKASLNRAAMSITKKTDQDVEGTVQIMSEVDMVDGAPRLAMEVRMCEVLSNSLLPPLVVKVIRVPQPSELHFHHGVNDAAHLVHARGRPWSNTAQAQ